MKIPPFRELNAPDSLGYWTNKKTGEKYGGQYISPLLIPNLKKVEIGFKKAMKNKRFLSNLEEQLVNHIGIVTPILRSRELEDIAGGERKIGKIFLGFIFDSIFCHFIQDFIYSWIPISHSILYENIGVVFKRILYFVCLFNCKSS